MTVVLLDLDGEPAAVARLLRQLLKRLGRDHGVKCASVRTLDNPPAPPATR